MIHPNTASSTRAFLIAVGASTFALAAASPVDASQLRGSPGSSIGNPQASPVTGSLRKGRLSRAAASGEILYVANGGNATVEMYKADAKNGSPRPIRIISDGVTKPVALAVDAAGDLFVANASTASSAANVEMYAPGSLIPAATYHAGISAPAALAIDENGTLYVGNASDESGSIIKGPTIREFPPGSTKPTTTISDPNAYQLTSLAVDAASNVYVASAPWLCCPPSAVDELVPHPPQPTVLAIAAINEGTDNNPPFLGLTIDSTGNLVAADGIRIAVYAPSAAEWPNVQAPTSTFGLRGAPSSVTFDSSRSHLFVVDSPRNEVFAYNYPGGTIRNIYTTNVQSPTAVAVGPLGPLPVRSPQPPPPLTPPKLQPGTIYAASSSGSVSLIDAKTFQVKGSITTGIDGPLGVAVDAHRRLYVANSSVPNVAVYKHGQASPWKTYAGGLTGAAEIAVGPDGTLAVTNCLPPCYRVTAQIVVYRHGSMSATTTLSAPQNGDYFSGLTFDANDNLYTDLSNGEGGSVLEYPAGRGGYGAPVTLIRDTYGGWLTLDSAGDLLVEAYLPFYGSLGVFPNGSTTPAYVIGRPLNQLPSVYAVDATEHFLYMHVKANNGVGQYWIFRYPSGTPYAVYKDPLGWNAGGPFAIDPPATVPQGWDVRFSRKP
jgi:YVTN family beta-propeller protein